MDALETLIAELARLPGIGRKTAQRITFHVLQQDGQAPRLADAFRDVAERVRACTTCGNWAEDAECAICRDARRDPTVLCVVEEPAAVTLVEQATGFRGRYHVLGGRLSPLDGVGPEALRLDRLASRVRDGGIREVILATNPSMEGEVTATYIQQLLAPLGVRVTRLARGLPVGGDLDYVDGVTLAHALVARQEVG